MQEEIKVQGDKLVSTVKKLINEGNVRRITIKNRDGRPILDVPLGIGVVGIALAPMLAAIGAAAGLLTECTIAVERDPSAPVRGVDEADLTDLGTHKE